MQVFHFSENPNIGEFVPRPPLAHPEAPARVWAIGEIHEPLYYFPSDCPRCCWWPLESTSVQDYEKFWLHDGCIIRIAVEERWLERILTTPIYRYTFESTHFVDCHDHGVFVASSTVQPLDVVQIHVSRKLFEQSGVELRTLPSLVELGQGLAESTMHFSLIRMRNAVGWSGPAGTPTIEVR